MSPLQIGIEAWRSISAHRLRSALTMLGIVIGIASVLLMLGIGDAVRTMIAREFAALGNGQLIVQPGTPLEVGGIQRRVGDVATLTVDDARALATLPTLRGAAPVLQGAFQLYYGEGNSNQMVMGVTPDMFALRNWTVDDGVSLSERDVQAAHRVILLGSKLVRKHFPTREPVGQVVRLDGEPFTVVGVLAGSGRTLDGSDLGELVVVPISAMPLRLARPGAVHYISLQARDPAQVPEAIDDAAELLRDRHRITGDRPDDFEITDLASLADASRSVATALSVGLGVIGGISLLVGGIGIMNIMLVSVSERVREIGIRMAIGAHRRHILQQFLAESMLLCLIGCALGLALATLAVTAVNASGAFHMRITGMHIGIAFGFASTVGLFFGYYPARQAALMRPVDCLRQG